MKKYVYQHILLCFVLLLTLFSAVPAFAEDAPEIVASGCCGYGTGKNLRWTLDSDGLLTISGMGYTPGDPVRENMIAAACTAGGSYEEVVYCTQCGYEFSREHKTADPAGHIPGRTVRENEIPAACTAAGGYDEAVFCANCPAELSRTHVETAATGHA